MKTVMQRQLVRREVEVDVVKCVPVYVDREITVNKCVPVQKEGTRVVCRPVWTEKEVDVVNYVRVAKEGTRKVCQPVNVKQTVEQRVLRDGAVRDDGEGSGGCAVCTGPVRPTVRRAGPPRRLLPVIKFRVSSFEFQVSGSFRGNLKLET